MNAAQSLKMEIERTPEPLLQEVYDFLLVLKARSNGLDNPGAITGTDAVRFSVPDFFARQKAIFGLRTVPDSQVIWDDMRADEG